MLDRSALDEIIGDALPAGAAIALAAQQGDEVSALAWGTDAAGSPADARTLFQAASMSKPVAAATALALVDRGAIDLDDQVNDRLTSWRLPDPTGWPARVTIRHLVTHSAGLNVHGFPGYEQGARLPSLVEVLDGTGPANTSPVRVLGLPGLFPKYSGGGFTVLQQLLEDVTGRTYPELVAELVLEPCGMLTATSALLLDPADAKRAARGSETGQAIPGGWNIYPELCAAGLWATPSDLVGFLTALRSAAEGPGGFLTPASASAMLSEQVDGWGLGIGLGADPPRFSHGGRNAGFVGNMLAARDEPYALAVMLSEPAVGALFRPLLLEAARSIGWSALSIPEPKDGTAGLQAEVLGIVGEYDRDNGQAVAVAIDGGVVLRVDDQAPLPLSFVAKDRWTSEVLHLDVELERVDGQPAALVIRQLGRELRAARRP